MEHKISQNNLTPKSVLRMAVSLPLAILAAHMIAWALSIYFKESTWPSFILDAGITTILALPIIYFFSYRPQLQQIHQLQQADEDRQNQYSKLLDEISERNLVEAALRKSEEEYRVLFEDSPIGIFRTTPKGAFTKVNSALVNILGYDSVEELIETGQNIFIEHWANLKDREFLRKQLASQTKAEMSSIEIKRRSGEPFLADFSIHVIKDDAGYPRYFEGTIQDVTERRQAEEIIQIRLRLIQYASTHTLDELLQNILDEIETISKSTIGFIHFVKTDQNTLNHQAWSTNTIRNMCEMTTSTGMHSDLDQAGIWADCIRLHQPIIHNDYGSLPNRKGIPEGHAPIVRELTVPISRDDQIVAIMGVGNKAQEYSANDVEIVTTLADFAWDIVQHKQAEIAISKSEELFRTMMNWTYDMEIWSDPQGSIIYLSPSCERITGWNTEDFMNDAELLVKIVHPDDQLAYKTHRDLMHDPATGMSQFEFRIIARDGSEHWIEHICRPLFGKNNDYLGRRVSSRDVSERKATEHLVKDRNQKLEELYLAEQHARQTAETLRSASLALTQSLNLPTVSKVLLEYITRLVPVDTASVVLLNEYKPTILTTNGYDRLSDPSAILSEYFQPESNWQVQQLIKDRKTIIIDDTSVAPGWNCLHEYESIRNWILVPLISVGQLIGFCEFGSYTAGFFQPDQIHEIEALARQSAVIIQNTWLFERVRAGRERFQIISQKLVKTQENERRYIARELHDETGQLLTSIIIGLEMLERQANHPDQIIAGIAELNRLVKKVMEDLHRLAVDLRPASLDHLGLVAAIRQQLETLSEKHQLVFNFQTIGLTEQRLSVELETTLYRITQESLTNVIRHARASRVDVSLERLKDSLILSIEDNGVGFDISNEVGSKKLGLFGMRERAELINGRFSIESSAGAGTTILVEVPHAP